MKELETYIGKIGICSKGLPGLILGRKELEWGLSWVGINPLNGKSWSSRNPRIISIEKLEKIMKGLNHQDPDCPVPVYQGPKFKRILPTNLQCTNCGHVLKPQDDKCQMCKDSDPPLNARVAKALGKKVSYITGIPDAYWGEYDSKNRVWHPCDPYDTDVALAIQALKIYCEKNKIYGVRIGFNYAAINKWYVEFKIGPDLKEPVRVDAPLLARTICKAIFKHEKQQNK